MKQKLNPSQPGYFYNEFRLLIAMEEMLETDTLSDDTKAWWKEAYGKVPTDQEIKEWVDENKTAKKK